MPGTRIELPELVGFGVGVVEHHLGLGGLEEGGKGSPHFSAPPVSASPDFETPDRAKSI